jgi:hypothetical protein
MLVRADEVKNDSSMIEQCAGWLAGES